MSANASEHAEPKAQRSRRKQAGVRQTPSTSGDRAREVATLPSEDVDLRERVWELHLRGVSKTRIAGQVGIHRETVGKLIQDCYRELGPERRARLKRKLDVAVARMRHVQEQAWEDHDADDERERAVLKATLEAAVPGMRYTSQRSSYLRLALDAEKEIARLEGLYAEDAPDVLGVLFQVIRIEGGGQHGGQHGGQGDA